jgi:hypothetical protein
MDISFISDGWSYSRNSGRLSARSSQRFSATATSPAKSGEVMARQTELLNQLVQAQMGQYHHQFRGRDEPPSASYQDFLNTQPPLFHKADEPLDADAWLCTIESNFALLSAPCSDENKALFAAQQLCGTARIWWDHYHAM